MTTPETDVPERKSPAWLETARRFYAPGFEVQTDKALGASNADWAELPEHERSFTVAHLLYLNLVAQRGTQRLLGEVRDLLDEVAAAAESDDDEDPDDDDDPPPAAPAAAVVGEDPPDAAPVPTEEPATAEPIQGELIIPGEDEDGGAP